MDFIKRFLGKKNRTREVIADFNATITQFDDNFVSSNTISVSEILKGNIYSLKEVLVEEKAKISGNVVSRTCTIKGTIYGNVLSSAHAHIEHTAIVTGDIKAKSLSIEPGSVINGTISIGDEIDERDLLEKIGRKFPTGVIKEPSLPLIKSPDAQQPVVKANKSEKQENNVSSGWY